MSLRARLVALLIVLAALGLVTLGVVTYTTQRAYQQQRVDDQTRAAMPVVGRSLDERGVRVPGAPIPPRNRYGVPPGGPDGASFSLPPGTFGERRDATGKVLGSVVLSYGQQPLSPPQLPAHLRGGEVLTVPAKGGGSVRYRVRVRPNPGGQGVTVVAVPLNGVQATLNRLLLVEGLVIAGVLLLLAAISWVLVRVELRPLERIGRTAHAIASGDLSRRVEVATPRTEVGRLGLALNEMLARLEQAFAEREASEARLRQFLSDASHELRTPLASIRGYAELFRIGAAREPEDTAKAMHRIEDEAARMGSLVEDLLTLARLDEVRDPVTERVDVTELAEDAVADAIAMDPHRAVTSDLPAEAFVFADHNQLRQVLANLVRNALVHTPPGTPVEVNVSERDGQVEIEVRDHGQGLPTADGSEVFGRFWRAESGRARGRAGAGLGLAIAAAIVARHGGEVEARNAQDGGASFLVRLPAAAATPGAALAGQS